MEIRVHYSEALVKRVTRRFWARLVGWQGFASVAVLAGLLLYLVTVDAASWFVPAFGAVLVLSLVVGAALYLGYRHRALATLRRMNDPTATFTFDDSRFSCRSDLGGGDLSWRAVTQVWTFPEAWLIFVSKGTYVTIPTDSLTEAARELIRSKVREHGGKVV